MKRRRDTATSNGSGNDTSSDVDEVFGPVTSETADHHQASSPTVREFTKKNDSVSYVLDLGGGEFTPTGASPLPYLTPSSPWTSRRNLVRFASLRYSHRPSTHH